jgi:hypothetical protein
MKQACESVGSYDVEKRVNVRARDGWLVAHMLAVGGLVHIVFAAAQTDEEQAEKDRKTREAFKAAAEHSADLQLQIHQLTKRAESAERQLVYLDSQLVYLESLSDSTELSDLDRCGVGGCRVFVDSHTVCRIHPRSLSRPWTGAVPKTSPETVPESGPENQPDDDLKQGPSR